MGTITKNTKIVAVQSVGEWSIEEKTTTEFFDDGELISTSNSRKCYWPTSKELTSDDIDARVVALARAQNWHTDDVKKASIENNNKDNPAWADSDNKYGGIEFGLTS